MGWFGKKTIAEHQVAALFVEDMLHGAKNNWDEILRRSRPAQYRPASSKVEAEWAQFYFALASIVVQIQTLPSLFPSSQAASLRAHIWAILGTFPDIGKTSTQVLDAFDQGWKVGAKSSGYPLIVVAGLLFDLLQLEDATGVGDQKVRDPLVLAHLADTLSALGGAWWKNAAAKYRIVPSQW